MELYVGIDVGSTTTKALALDVETGRPIKVSQELAEAIREIAKADGGAAE